MEYIPSGEEGISFKSIGNSIKNVFFSTASKKNEYSYELSSIQQGAYTYFLVIGLGNSGYILGDAIVRNESFIGFTELHNYAAKRIGSIVSDQNPQIYTSSENANTIIKGSF